MNKMEISTIVERKKREWGFTILPYDRLNTEKFTLKQGFLSNDLQSVVEALVESEGDEEIKEINKFLAPGFERGNAKAIELVFQPTLKKSVEIILRFSNDSRKFFPFEEEERKEMLRKGFIKNAEEKLRQYELKRCFHPVEVEREMNELLEIVIDYKKDSIFKQLEHYIQKKLEDWEEEMTHIYYVKKDL